MSAPKWTPGPWRIADEDFVFNSSWESTSLVATTIGYCPDHLPSSKERKANISLISAAPDLYDALSSIENDDGRIPSKIWEMRNDALAKARGES